MTQVLISIGSNQQEPKSQIMAAFLSLEQKFTNLHWSNLYKTEPVGTKSQIPFINAAVVFETSLLAPQLLQSLLDMEREAGRIRSQAEINAPRSLDLDIILFGDEIWNESELSIPHPRFRERRFVLEPAAEIAGNMHDPVSQKDISQLLSECSDNSWVNRLEEEVEVV